MNQKQSFAKVSQKLLNTKVRLSHTKGHLTKTANYLSEKREHLLEKRRSHKQMRRLRKQVKKARGTQPWYGHTHILPLLRHLLPLLSVCFLHHTMLLGSLCLMLSYGAKGHAQTLGAISLEDTCIDSIPVGSLRAEVDALAFFHDNEYSSQLVTGYSLPGVRITPHLAYNPIRQINIEAGASLLLFNGANKYPCYAYHDIGTWKGTQYQHGAHALPWVRLQASFKHMDLVLGNIYGGSNHGLSTPLYNAEQNMSADPEMGLQILAHRKHLKSDTWLNWQSYIFKTDSHQEAFTVGEHMRILWGKTEGKWQWYTPLQITIQHRGGEQDTTQMGVQTLSNAALGLGVESHRLRLKAIDFVSAQVNAMVSYQQKGGFWPFTTGAALHGGAEIGLLGHLHIAADLLHAPKQFATLYGNSLFSTISLKHPGQTYHGTSVVRLAAGYQYTFGKAYTLGAEAELFHEQSAAYKQQPRLSETNFSFGVYFHVAPSFLIKKF